MDDTSHTLDFSALYANFASSTTPLDCGQLCAPHNPSGKPFCCDICQAVPVAYKPEWQYLKTHTDLWHLWRGDECEEEPCEPDELFEQTPEHLLLLSCKGPQHCQRDFRASSCRQFPFFPYITSDFRFIGLAYDWEFETKCWVINNLDQVTSAYRAEFILFFDTLFSYWLDDMDSYATLSEEVREHYSETRRRIPLLHRNGKVYLISPRSEKMTRIDLQHLKKNPPYNT